jgi:fused signal recognition particle receptor
VPLFRRRSAPEKRPQLASESPPPGLRARLAKSRDALSRGLGGLLRGGALDEDLFEDLEDLLISADLGVPASRRVMEGLRGAVKSGRVADPKGVLSLLRDQIEQILAPCARKLSLNARPFVVLVVGVNGVGKTTTIAKLAGRLQDQGYSVMLAAGDTFRAAAVEQLQRWGERLDIPVIAQEHGSDAAAVAHDALAAARARGVDVLIVDTAGRLHTQSDLMEQLKKVKRVLAKLDAAAPHEVLQVLDAGTGQNALSQLEHFNAAVGVDGLCLTKLDGTAKGGVLVAIAEKFAVPIRYIGVGEKRHDLREFDAAQFAAALIPETLNA